MGVLGNFAPEAHFGLKKSDETIDKINKDFELYQVFMYNFLCQTVLIFPVYILLVKRIGTLWSRGIRTFWVQRTRQGKFGSWPV